MKRLIYILFCILVSNSALAKYTTDGYYRVHNKATNRFIYVLDNTGSINISTSSADMGAIELHKDTARLHYDPASIIYIQKVADKQYDLKAQGTGVHSLIGYYVDIYQKSDGSYQVYAEGKYLDDNETSSRDLGYLGTERTGDYRLWYIDVLDNNSNYFGIKAGANSGVKIGSAYYKPFYADFPFEIKSSGMKIYYISKVYDNAAIWEEATGVIPASTPVYIACNDTLPWHNKITIAPKAQTTSISDNKLKGVYFNNANRRKSKDARTAYNPVTMRCLASTADGKICYAKTTSLDYIPANESYLPVSSTAMDTLRVMTEEEYAEYSKAKSLTLSDTALTLHPSESAVLTATILPTSATVRTPVWGSSDPTTVSIVGEGSQVYVNALKIGEATITARTQDGTDIIAQCTVTVTPVLATGVVLDQGTVKGSIGDTLRLKATIVPSNATYKELTWSSSNDSVAKVNDGLVTIMGLGNATLTVSTTDGSGVSTTCPVMGVPRLATSVSISARIASNDTINIGDTVSLSATVLPEDATSKSVTWISDNSSVVSVSQQGLCTALQAGKATIKATTTDGSDKKDTFVICVHPKLVNVLLFPQDSIHLYKNDTLELSYVILPKDATDLSVTWNSTNPNVAAITQQGILTTHNTGTTLVVISANDASGLKDTCVIVVDSIVRPVKAGSLILHEDLIELYPDESATLKATLLPQGTTNRKLKWTVQKEGIITYEANGLTFNMSAQGEGETMVIAQTTDSTNLSDSCLVRVKPRLVEQIILSTYNIELYPGDKTYLTYNVLPTNATNNQVEYIISDTSIIAITEANSQLCVQAKQIGVARITLRAKDNSGIEAQCNVSVTPKLLEVLTISATKKDMYIGEEASLYVSIYPNDATNPNIIWESSNPSVVSIEGSGNTITIKALYQGNATITASSLDGSGLTAQCHVYVEPIYVTYLRIKPTETIRLYENESTQLSVVIRPYNATYQTVTWSTEDSDIATIDEDGRLTAIKAGTTTVIASTIDGSGIEDQRSVVVSLFSDLINTVVSSTSTHSIYSLQGQRLSSIPASGLYIVDGKLRYVNLQ